MELGKRMEKINKKFQEQNNFYTCDEKFQKLLSSIEDQDKKTELQRFFKFHQKLKTDSISIIFKLQQKNQKLKQQNVQCQNSIQQLINEKQSMIENLQNIDQNNYDQKQLEANVKKQIQITLTNNLQHFQQKFHNQKLKYKKQISNLQSTIQQLDEIIKNYKVQDRENQTKYQQLEKQTEKLSDENVELQKKIQYKQQENQQIQQQLQQRLQKQSQDYQEQIQMKSQLQDQIMKEKEQNIEELKSIISNYNLQNDKLSKEIQYLRKLQLEELNIKKIKEHIKVEQQTLDQKSTKLKEKEENIEKQIKQRKLQIEKDLQKKYEEKLQDQLKSYKEFLANKYQNFENNKLSQLTKSYKKEIDVLQAKIQDSNQSKTSKKNNQETQTQIDVQDQFTQIEDEEFHKLKLQFQEQKNQLVQYKQENIDLRNKCFENEEQLQILHKQVEKICLKKQKNFLSRQQKNQVDIADVLKELNLNQLIVSILLLY